MEKCVTCVTCVTPSPAHRTGVSYRVPVSSRARPGPRQFSAVRRFRLSSLLIIKASRAISVTLTREEAHDVASNRLFPRIAFEPIVLLRPDMLALEFAVRPPFFAGPISADRLRRRVGRDRARARRYRSSRRVTGQNRRPPGLVSKVGLLIGCPDEYALPGLDHFFAPIGRPVALDGPRDERLEELRFRSASAPRARRSLSAICRASAARRPCRARFPAGCRENHSPARIAHAVDLRAPCVALEHHRI